MFYLHFGDEREEDYWLKCFKQQAPELRVVTAKDKVDFEKVHWAGVWNPKPNFFKSFPNLQGVFALSAGVDALVSREDIPNNLPIMRLLDAGMAQQMIDYLLWVTLTLQGDFDLYIARQKQKIWQAEPSKSLDKPRIGILGLGELGIKVAQKFAELGYSVKGWKRTAVSLQGVEVLVGDEGFSNLLKQTDLLVNLLPNTQATAGILNKQNLEKLPQGASLVNIGRGQQLVDSDLISLLDSKHLRLAVLDVFKTEPLPLEPVAHPFWTHPQVLITPHIAAYTLPELAVEQVVDNLKRLAQGEKPLGLVDLALGY
ncbi:2-hydroxyacid dehydrogenase [Marinospirillum insulare]|uniref:Glyoxylate/hydroxypyruvate reductase A n=1 Tax=Marinospirillum insulare TaxID=217169 RepID=A0ABQ6A0U6_9GAMM|nr:glyoxylate/hydroxypyruvate reductase A [Marinospirillum insulare]GLR65282.1 glyoxylate/hydroxypyruvate reductase A [Marinospirillum insulare]